MNPAYYESRNIEAYPSSNSTDNGKLMLEENVTELTTKLTRRNFCLSKDDFKLTLDGNKVTVSQGKANILGYMIHTNKEIVVESPDNTISPGIITLGLKLAYDSSNHILGDVGVEGSIKYFNGVYGIWLNQENITEDTLILGTAKWDGTNISDLTEYADKDMIFDINKILVYPGITLLEYLDNIPRKYIHKYGDKAVEIDSTGEDVYNGTGGDVYGDLYFKTSEDDKGNNSYGIKLGLSGNKQVSEVELKPLDKSTVQYKALLGSNHSRSYLKLGVASLSYLPSNNIIFLDGAPVEIEQETTINNILKINTSDIDYIFDSNEYRSTHNKNNIIEKHTDSESSIIFSKTDNSQYASIIYNYDDKKLNIGGLGCSLNFDIDLDACNINIKEGSKIKFSPDDAFIDNDSFKIGTPNNYINYNPSTGLQLDSVQSESLKLYNTSKKTYSQIFNSGLVTLHGNSSTATGIKFEGEGSSKSVLLSNQYDTDILKLTGSFVVDGDVSTVNGGKVYNAVYNDGVEFFEKSNKNDIIEPGDIVCVDNNGLCKKVSSEEDRERVIGVCSSPDTYGYVLGGYGLENNEKVPVGLFGRLYVNTNDNSIKSGDILISDTKGFAIKISDFEKESKYIIGMAMKSPYNGKVYIKIK